MKYRKRPVVIEAEQITDRMAFGDLPLPAGVSRGDGDPEKDVPVFFLSTLEGVMMGHIGDWVITGVEGERYFCQDSIFRKTYEDAEDDVPAPEVLPQDLNNVELVAGLTELSPEVAVKYLTELTRRLLLADEVVLVSVKYLGPWMVSLMDDPKTCKEMRIAINLWLLAIDRTGSYRG